MFILFILKGSRGRARDSEYLWHCGDLQAPGGCRRHDQLHFISVLQFFKRGIVSAHTLL